MLYFTYSSIINAPIDTVWQFHERDDVLNLLTPPWQPVEVIRREGGLDVGAISEFRLFVGPVPLDWLAKHTECEPPYLFVDVQEKGPLQFWTHRHQFADENGCTRLTDAIAFSLPGNWLGNSLGGWFVKAQLNRLFTYRHQVTRQYCQR